MADVNSSAATAAATKPIEGATAQLQISGNLEIQFYTNSVEENTFVNSLNFHVNTQILGLLIKGAGEQN